MDLWIIYTNTFSYAKMIAEMFESYLGEEFNVSVGNAEVINPSLVVDEKPEFLIIGQVFRESLFNLKIQSWIEKFIEISKSNNFKIQKVAIYALRMQTWQIHRNWKDIFYEYFSTEDVYSNPLILTLSTIDGTLGKEVQPIIKRHCIDLLKFFLN